ncbi:MAG: hypothetical protein K2M17_04600 [Bacilli bacterium]|nr:hypothetical protein [Bacilli bacterium]
MKKEDVKIKKINIVYLLGYIFVPMLFCACCFGLSMEFFPKGNMAVILIMGPSILSFVWWVFGGTFLFKRRTKYFTQELDAAGFKRNQTFYGRGQNVFIDLDNGEIGLVFFWNPFESYIFPASKVEKAWVDDGCHGAGFMKGSSYVRFLFIIDDIKVGVYTFTSNQRFRMDSDYILTGISKADMMVQMIEEAKNASKNKSNVVGDDKSKTKNSEKDKNKNNNKEKDKTKDKEKK